MSKTLIVYFSRTGEQYSVGNITKGNTAIVAEIIAEKTDGDLFEIKVVNDNYPNEYTPLIQFAKKEKQENARPEIIGDVNIDNYDTVFIGYPNWWAEMPMPVYTFLEKYNLSSKKVYKFCTHEGSGGVHTDDFALYGHIAQNERPQAEKKVSEWLKNIAY
ncbi:flavodoxin [bacterium]|jgi:flavodoxin|nr:flavodoxin [bacterium]